MFPGYASRIDIELRKIYTENTLKLAKTKTIKIPITIIDSPRRKYSVFIGATILSNMYNNAIAEREYWISKTTSGGSSKIKAIVIKNIY